METWMPIFVGVVALAVVIQTIILAVMAVVVSKTAKRVEEIAGEVHGRVNPILSRIQILVEESQPRINAVIADAAEISNLAREQAQRVDRFARRAFGQHDDALQLGADVVHQEQRVEFPARGRLAEGLRIDLVEGQDAGALEHRIADRRAVRPDLQDG